MTPWPASVGHPERPSTPQQGRVVASIHRHPAARSGHRRAPSIWSTPLRYRPVMDAATFEGLFVQHLPGPAQAIESTFPAVVDVLTPSAIRTQIAKRGEGAWCERRWIEDYDKLGA